MYGRGIICEDRVDGGVAKRSAGFGLCVVLCSGSMSEERDICQRDWKPLSNKDRAHCVSEVERRGKGNKKKMNDEDENPVIEPRSRSCQARTGRAEAAGPGIEPKYFRASAALCQI